MVIALLALLGADLIVIVAVLAVVLSRRRWVAKQSGVLKGAIRVVDGDVDGLAGDPRAVEPGAVKRTGDDR